MTEKKRGRPRKMTTDTEQPATTEVETAQPEMEDINSLARRIWEGQSVDLSVKVRMTRIKSALSDKGYDLADLTFEGK